MRHLNRIIDTPQFLVVSAILLFGLIGCKDPLNSFAAADARTLDNTATATIAQSNLESLSPTRTDLVLDAEQEKACLVVQLDAIGENQYQTSAYNWSPSGNILAYLTSDVPNPSTYKVKSASAPSFSNPQDVSSSALQNVFWSPDGTRIAFGTHRIEDTLDTTKVVEVENGTEIDLFPGSAAKTNPGTGPKSVIAWRDDTHLFASTGCGAACTHPLELNTITLEQSLLEEIDEGWAYYWSPNRHHVVYGAGAMPQIWLAQIIGDQIQKQSTFDKLNQVFVNGNATKVHYTIFQDWAQDSSNFLFLRQPSNQTKTSTLWQWNIDSQTASSLLEGIVKAAWSPNGKLIAFYALGEPRIRANS